MRIAREADAAAVPGRVRDSLSTPRRVGAPMATNPVQRGARRERETIPGYKLGASDLARAPVGVEDLEKIKAVLGWTREDDEALRASGRALQGQVDGLLDAWYGFIASQPPLVEAFMDVQTGRPDEEYMEAVRKRFAQWVMDTASAQYDQQWLDYQAEIGRRHTREGKNTTDNVRSTPYVPFRYLFALEPQLVKAMRPFLERGNVPPEDVDGMVEAWHKSVLLQLTLWSQPYVKDGQF
jgi:hypothetical protein